MSQRVAAQIARELTRREIEREGDGVDEEEEDDAEYDPEKDSDNDVEEDDVDADDDDDDREDGKRKKRKSKRRKTRHEESNGDNSIIARNTTASREKIEARQKAEEIFAEMRAEEKRARDAQSCGVGTLHVPFHRGQMGRDPLPQSYVVAREEPERSNDTSGVSEEALHLAKTTLHNVGMTDYVDNVKFAGEIITVARRLEKSEANAKEEAAVAVSGLDRMVAALARKKGISTVEKTSIDWEKYKHEKNLEEELRNASRAGVVEKEAFLSRVDARQFEIEKAERERARAKRDLEAAKEKAGL